MTIKIETLIKKALKEHTLALEEILSLLAIDDTADLEALYAAARETRNHVTGHKVFLYGFVYFTTWCRNNCNFCYFRKSNDIDRYRKSPEDILLICEELSESGVHLIDLTMGEDESYHKDQFSSLFESIKDIKLKTGLPIMISPGVVDDDLIDQFAGLGTEWYALYQETHNPVLFKKLRTQQDYDQRMHAKIYAKEKGMLIEEGILTGVGETLKDIAHSMLEMGRIGAKQLRVMTFVPQEGIPMKAGKMANENLECKIIAILRLLYPHALIPASLDVEGIEGLSPRMAAGANLITSIIPPKKGLSGVAQNGPEVAEEGRSASQVTAILAEMGLEPASAEDYQNYMKTLRAQA